MVPVLVVKDVVVCGDLAETLATADLVVPEVGVVGEGADDLVSPVLADAAVVPEWWVAVAAVALFVVLAFMMDDGRFFFFFIYIYRARKKLGLVGYELSRLCETFHPDLFILSRGGDGRVR